MPVESGSDWTEQQNSINAKPTVNNIASKSESQPTEQIPQPAALVSGVSDKWC